MLLFQEFEFEVIVNPGKQNIGLYYLSQMESGENEGNFDDVLLDVKLFRIEAIAYQFNGNATFLAYGRVP